MTIAQNKVVYAIIEIIERVLMLTNSHYNDNLE